MLKLTVKPDCGNAPKKSFLRDFNVAFAEANVDFILDQVSNDIEWTLIGESTIEGKNDFEAALRKMAHVKAESLTINGIITHGKEAALHGEMTLNTGDTYIFCDIYEFVSAGKLIVRKMHSFVTRDE